MPSRLSDRGRALAAALRRDPYYQQAKMLAEFTEPYGTVMSAKRIFEGNADIMDYAAGIPVVGLPARFAKRFKTIKKAAEEAKKFKSREVLTEMNIDDFLKLAKEGFDPAKAKRLKGVEKFDDVPYLMLDTSGDVAKVVGHEGRHRALALREMGETTMPVTLRDGRIRWDQQDPKDWDYNKIWPTKIESESGDIIGKFPIKQGESGVIEEALSMDLRPTEKRALLDDLMKDFNL